MATIRVGISGWRYEPWRGKFYPKGLPQKDELRYAASQLSSIEINGTFYSLQRPSYFKDWASQTPDDFVFSVKGPNFITHLKRLRDIDEPLANFFASGVLSLNEKLGPFLWQFPPNFQYDRERFESFFELLPGDTNAAVKLAKQHGKVITKDRVWLKTDAKRRIRHAIEFRDESFLTREFIDLLREYNIAMVIADTAERYPYVEDMTADFVYARMHGDEELYRSGYSAAALKRWADRFGAWSKGREPADANRVLATKGPKAKSRDVYVYFDNSVKVHSPMDAMKLAKLLS